MAGLFRVRRQTGIQFPVCALKNSLQVPGRRLGKLVYNLPGMRPGKTPYSPGAVHMDRVRPSFTRFSCAV